MASSLRDSIAPNQTKDSRGLSFSDTISSSKSSHRGSSSESLVGEEDEDASSIDIPSSEDEDDKSFRNDNDDDCYFEKIRFLYMEKDELDQ